jgi:hypothetical protein
VVRQDRVYFEFGKAFVQLYDYRFQIFNVSTFGCTLIIPLEDCADLLAQSAFQNNSELMANVYYEETPVQSLRLRYVRDTKEVFNSTANPVWAFEVVENAFEISQLQAFEKAQSVIVEQTKFVQKRNEIPESLKMIVFELKDAFDHVKKLIDEVEKTIPDLGAQKTLDFRTHLILRLAHFFGKIVPKIYKNIPLLLQKHDATEKQKFYDFARAVLGDFIYGAPFAARAYRKPRGYAGDYEMMNHLYQNEAMGETLFYQCMHKYLIDEPAGEAVKNRANYLLKKLIEMIQASKENTIHVASIASGPAMEVQMLLENLNQLAGKTVEFDFFDQDEESLKYAQKQILSKDKLLKSGFKFNFINAAIKNIITDGLVEKKYHLIYSAGLFDYFSDPVAKMACEQLFRGLDKGGNLIVGNFNIDNPTTPIMEILLDWNLIYRSVEDLQKLFGHISTEMSVEVEPLKINLFANLRR